MREFKLLYAFFIVILTVSITYTGHYLGTELYLSNADEACTDIIGVEITDYIEEVRYALGLGRVMESFYDMDDRLDEITGCYEEIDGIYLVRDDYSVVYSSSDASALPDGIDISGDDVYMAGERYYSGYPVTDGYRLIVSISPDIVEAIRGDKLEEMKRFSDIGCVTVIIIQMLLLAFIRNERMIWRSGIATISAWVLILGVYVCMINYSSYIANTERIEAAISDSYKADVARLEGSDEGYAHDKDADGYLERYIQATDGIVSITPGADAGVLVFEISRPRLNSVIFKYILQILLVIFFMSIGLWEFRLFLNETLPGDNGSSQDDTSEAEILSGGRYLEGHFYSLPTGHNTLFH